MSEPRLKIKLTHCVHETLTIDVDLAISQECVILFGRSGAGKSTLLRLIAGLIRPDSGRIQLDHHCLFDSQIRKHAPLRSRGIGLIYQDDLLFPHLCVAANLGFGLKGRPRGEVVSRVAEIARLCGVDHLLDRAPATLSGGERQRVGLARALAPRPRLLLCDEPVSALDLEGRQSLIARLAAVRRVEGTPTIYITHSPTEALALGSTMLVMEAGTIIDRGTPLEVLGRHGATSMADWSSAQNVFTSVIDSHLANESRIKIDGGPTLIVPTLMRAVGTPLVVRVRADDILLARSQVEGLSARNIVEGTVDQIVRHGDEAEVLVRTGSATWVVSVVPTAVTELGLNPGVEVFMIIKARGCHILDADV